MVLGSSLGSWWLLVVLGGFFLWSLVVFGGSLRFMVILGG